MQGIPEDFEGLRQTETPKGKPDSNLWLGSVVRIDDKIARIRGTSEFALHAVLFISREQAIVALIGDNCLATVPTPSLIRATEAELFQWKTNNRWDIADVRIK